MSKDVHVYEELTNSKLYPFLKNCKSKEIGMKTNFTLTELFSSVTPVAFVFLVLVDLRVFEHIL